MKVLIACEFSGRVRDAFLVRGHDAWSCDLIESEQPGPHIIGDVRHLLHQGWGLMIAFPPCTYLCRSGAWAYRDTPMMYDAIDFVRELWEAPIPQIAIENPVGFLSTRWRKPSQYMQPYEHGHGEKKKTCLWLKNLPYLLPSEIVPGREESTWITPGIPKGEKWRYRSRTYPGIAQAMASQWGLHAYMYTCVHAALTVAKPGGSLKPLIPYRKVVKWQTQSLRKLRQSQRDVRRVSSAMSYGMPLRTALSGGLRSPVRHQGKPSMNCVKTSLVRLSERAMTSLPGPLSLREECTSSRSQPRERPPRRLQQLPPLPRLPTLPPLPSPSRLSKEKWPVPPYRPHSLVE